MQALDYAATDLSLPRPAAVQVSVAPMGDERGKETVGVELFLTALETHPDWEGY